MLKTFEGELMWVRITNPELRMKNKPTDPDEYQWRAAIIPTKESLMDVMDLQSLGVKNKLKKTDDNRYIISFSRPEERKNKRTGKVLQSFDAPKAFKADGVTPLTDLIGNGSKGKLTVDVYEHAAFGGGKAHAARLHSITVTELVKYEGKS
jgi:hypothetical protein